MPNKPALLTALLPLLLLAACASDSQLSPVPQVPVLVSKQIQIPALPQSAKQTNSPDYLQKLTVWREKAARRLTELSSED